MIKNGRGLAQCHLVNEMTLTCPKEQGIKIYLALFLQQKLDKYIEKCGAVL
jgi:hypothetical protein